MSLLVNEIFYSIQGESSFAGRPCVFIRLTGCNLRCAYCDTAYAYEEGRLLEIKDIEARVGDYQCRLVEITGGEPLLQEETPLLIKSLLDQGYTVLLETNGSLDIRPIDPRCIRIVDVKCPSSGEKDRNILNNLACLSVHDEVKFILADRGDYDYAKNILALYPGLSGLMTPPLFSPVHGRLAPDRLAAWMLEDHVMARLHLQLHKVIWEPGKRGV